MKNRLVSMASCLLLSLTISSASFAAPQATPAPGTAPQSAQAGDQLAAIRAACTEDAQKLCAGVQPGGGRLVACLKEHKDSVSDRCKQAAGLPANPSSSSAPSAASSPAKSPSSVAGPSVSAAGSKAKPAAAPKAAPATAPAPDLVIIGGERFVKRTLIDSQQGGMNAVTIHLPESWHFEGKIEWHYD